MSPEDLLVEALDALMDAEDERLAAIEAECRLALDDGSREVMRACLSAIVARVRSITTDEESAGSQPQAILTALRLARLRAGKS